MHTLCQSVNSRSGINANSAKTYCSPSLSTALACPFTLLQGDSSVSSNKEPQGEWRVQWYLLSLRSLSRSGSVKKRSHSSKTLGIGLSFSHLKARKISSHLESSLIGEGHSSPRRSTHTMTHSSVGNSTLLRELRRSSSVNALLSIVSKMDSLALIMIDLRVKVLDLKNTQ